MAGRGLVVDRWVVGLVVGWWAACELVVDWWQIMNGLINEDEKNSRDRHHRLDRSSGLQCILTT